MDDKTIPSMSNSSFNKMKQFVNVRLQQGVPLVDSDWNEQDDIRKYELKAFIKWFVGNGVPRGSDAFLIQQVSDGSTDNDFEIVGGTGDNDDDSQRCLVDGWEVFNPDTVKFTEQTDQQTLSPPKDGEGSTRTDTVYLDVWETLVHSDVDPDIINSDIGKETCARVKLNWVVRVLEGETQIPPRKDDHAYYALAFLKRKQNKNVIEETDIIDLRTTCALLPQQERETGLNLTPTLTATDPNKTELTALRIDPTFNDGLVEGEVKHYGLIVTDGNVGIGTASPNNPLSVSGGVTIGSTDIEQTAPANGLLVEGDVGIGTELPQAKLDVNGKIKSKNVSIFEKNENEISISSTTWTDIEGMTINPEGLGGACVLILFKAAELRLSSNTNIRTTGEFRLMINNDVMTTTRHQVDYVGSSGRGDSRDVVLNWVGVLPSGTPSIQVQWRITTETPEDNYIRDLTICRTSAADRTLSVIELGNVMSDN